MIPILQPLPIDWTGKSLHNRTKGEIHNLGPQAELPYRIIVMERGYFYTDDIFMIDSRGYILKPDIDYQCIVISREIMNEVKKTACAVILITNPSVSNLVKVDAQMVGGRFCSLNIAILETASNVIMSANRKVFWKDIKNKPNDYRPSGHLHALWELYGFTEQTGLLKRMTTALDKITAKDFIGLFDEFLIEFNQIEDGLTDIEARLTTHINDQNNPHQVNSTQLELNEVFNGPIATQQEAISTTSANRNSYTTPFLSKEVILTNFAPRLTEHVNDLNNPHRDTAANLGTLTNLEWQQLANQYYDRGETVALTNRLDGRIFADYTEYARRDIPINQIVTGVLSSSLFTNSNISPTSTEYILQPSSSGYMVWRPYRDAIDQWIKKGNNILHAGSNSAVSIASGQAFLTAALGVNHPNGTIGIYRQTPSWGYGTGNGSITTSPIAAAMGVLLNGVWQLSPPVYSV